MEDLLELLPHALEPVPAEFLARLRNLPEWLAFHERALAWAADDDTRSKEEAESAWDLAYGVATLWFAERRLYTSYLKDAPSIWFWREGDTITLAFRTSHLRAEDGTATWFVGDGLVTMSVDSLLREFVSFHEAFMREMQGLVERLSRECGAEAEDIVREHAMRAAMVTTGDALLATATKTDWAAVEAALSRLGAEIG